MRRLLKAIFLTSALLGVLGTLLGGYWYWSAGGPGGMARGAGRAASQALSEWGRDHPELAASLRRHLAEAAGKPGADLGDLHLGIDAWLQENATDLAEWQGLTLAEDEDDLVKVLELRRGLTRRLAESTRSAAPGEADAPPTSPGVLEISGGDSTPGQVGEAHSEPGLEIRAADDP